MASLMLSSAAFAATPAMEAKKEAPKMDMKKMSGKKMTKKSDKKMAKMSSKKMTKMSSKKMDSKMAPKAVEKK